MQPWGLIVLLLSKAAGYSDAVPESEQDTSAGVLHTQRGLAEIAEIIRISFLIHQVGLILLHQLESGEIQLCAAYAKLKRALKF